MRTKLLSTLRASVAVLFVAVQLPLMTLFMSTANAAAVGCNDANSQNTNDVCYWEAQGNGTCVKDDGPFTGTTYTLPTAPTGQTYSLLVVNGGSNDATYTNPTAGTPYTAPLNNGGHFPTISHAIYCTETSTTTVTPGGVTFVDLCGTANDTFTVNATTGVTYHLNDANGAVVSGANNAGSGTVTVVAVADQGFVLDGTSSWTHTFTDVACDTHVTPAAVTFNEMCGTDNDTFDVPTTTGVTYHLNDANGAVVSGSGNTGSGTVTVVAVANQGVVLDGTTSWSYTFTNEDCTPPPVDLCPNVPGDQTELPVGFVQQNDHTCKVVICHATAAINNPYVKETVAVDSVDGATGNDEGQGDHLSHTGPIFNSSMQQGDNWGDIIPPVPAQTEGLNWTTEGQAIWNDDCNVPTPPVDVCPNLEGTQTDVPEGMVKNDDGNCVTPPVVTDVCPNIEGTQTEVPAGMLVDLNGNCITGGQGGETPPVLVTVVENGQVLGASTTAGPSATQLVNTGSTVLANLFAGMFLVSIAALVTILSRKTGGSSLVSNETTTSTAV